MTHKLCSLRVVFAHAAATATVIVTLLLLLLSLLCTSAMAVDRSKFRTCEQTSFCRRHRRTADHTPQHYRYQIIPESISFKNAPTDFIGDQPPFVDSNNNNSKQDQKKWSSLQRRLFGESGSGTNGSNNNNNIHYWMGGATLSGTMRTSASNKNNKKHSNELLHWTLTVLPHGIVRWRIDETTLDKPRRTYDELVLEPQPESLKMPQTNLILGNITSGAAIIKPFINNNNKNNNNNNNKNENAKDFVSLQFKQENDDKITVLMRLEPVQLRVFRGTTPIVTIGDDLHFEVRQHKKSDGTVSDENKEEAAAASTKSKTSDKEIVGYWEDGLAIYADGTREERRQLSEEDQAAQTHQDDTTGLWEEKFGDHLDTKPYGPTSVGLTVTMHASHIYGLPEHASSLKLQDTLGPDAHYKDPYRLYNLDVFEYELDESMALYGAVPLIVGQSVTSGTTGVFYFNPSETFVDVQQQQQGDNDSTTSTHWISESGVLDLFILPGPDPPQMYQQYAALTGTTTLPPIFALGYHQCRWNYKDEKDVFQVHDKFETLDYPYDVLWLDIEHTDGKRYFTWDKNAFPKPKDMQEHLWEQRRRMVTIIDPHIKRDDNYYIHKEATAKGYYIKDKDGNKDYDGWCWPGSSSYLDFTDANVRAWWAEQFMYNKYQKSSPTLFTWNDMNEPSVFNGPEITMQKDLRNLRGDEHREWHNLYGMLFHRATMEGQIQRNSGQNIRPFVLSRSFFAGSQRYGAVWTGDNTAEWGHLEIATPMLLSLNLAAYSFVGADVGGFFGDPDAELFTRWNQAGAYQPFYRGHAHHDSKRREPWMFDDETLVRARRVAMERYALLPYWYTVFYEAYTSGMPVMRTLWMQYPKTQSLFTIDDQFMIGSDLLIKPITAAGVTDTQVVFPSDSIWYDARTLAPVTTLIQPSGVTVQTVEANLDIIPVYQRGGSIIPRKLRLRRSTATMHNDPYTLFIALDSDGLATGKLYMDDEETFGHEKSNEYSLASFNITWGKEGSIVNSVEIGNGWRSKLVKLKPQRMIERIVVTGVKSIPSSITFKEQSLEFQSPQDEVLIIRKPELSALEDWIIQLEYT